MKTAWKTTIVLVLQHSNELPQTCAEQSRSMDTDKHRYFIFFPISVKLCLSVVNTKPDHCIPGDTELECLAKVGSGHSNPLISEVMHKFVNPGVVKTNLSNDDIAGIRTLYGELKTTLPVTGDYALDKDEILAIGIEMRMQIRDGHDTVDARQAQARSIQEMYNFVNSGDIDEALKWEKIPGYSSGMKFEEYMDSSYRIIQDNLYSRTDEELKIIRLSSSVGIVEMDDMINKHTPANGVASKNLLEQINQKNMELRKAVIDEQRRRQ